VRRVILVLNFQELLCNKPANVTVIKGKSVTERIVANYTYRYVTSARIKVGKLNTCLDAIV